MERSLTKSEGTAKGEVTCAPPEPDFATVRRRTILLVEDEALVRDVIEEVLQSVGYRVLKTQSAEEALQVYERWGGELHLLLTDVVMPGKTGRDLARDLRARCPAMNTIFMSGYGEGLALLGAERDASVFYLSKPFSVPKLLMKVEEVLSRHAELSV